jgi:hypothetical protein
VTVAIGDALYLNTPILGCALAGAAVFGVASTVFRLSARAVIVRAVPGCEHGRAFSGWESVQCISFVLPTAATGTLVAVLGLRTVLAWCTIGASVVAAASLRPARRTSHSHSRPPHQTLTTPRPGLPATRTRTVNRWPPPAQPGPDPDRYRLPQPSQDPSS